MHFERLIYRERYALNKDVILKRRRDATIRSIIKHMINGLLMTDFHTAERPNAQGVVTQLRYTSDVEGIPVDVMMSDHTPFHGPNFLKSSRSAFCNKENVNYQYSGIESSQCFGLRSPLQNFNCILEEKQELKRDRENARYKHGSLSLVPRSYKYHKMMYPSARLARHRNYPPRPHCYAGRTGKCMPNCFASHGTKI